MEPMLQENKIIHPKEILMAVQYLPCIDFYAAATKFEKIILETHETFPKQTYRNRCHIYSANGLLALSIPLIKKNHTITKDIKIDYSTNWNIKHWRAIQSAYSNTAFFLFYHDYFVEIFLHQSNFLTDWNIKLFETINKVLKINFSYNFTATFEKNPITCIDGRELVHPKHKPLLSNYPEYFQPFSEKHGFIPNLSIIDALFNLGHEETKKYIEKIAPQITLI